MKIIIIIAIIAAIYYYVTHSNSQKVWRTLSKHPDALMAMIEDSSDFCVTKKCGAVFNKPTGVNWVGPFNIVVPGEGRVEFYGKADVYEKRLADLAAIIERGKPTVGNAYEKLRRSVEGR